MSIPKDGLGSHAADLQALSPEQAENDRLRGRLDIARVLFRASADALPADRGTVKASIERWLAIDDPPPEYAIQRQGREPMKKLTIQETRERVAAIAAVPDDVELGGQAHRMQDALWQEVLQQLADEGSELAKVALETTLLKFPRWFE